MGFVSRNQIKRDADPLPPPAKIEVPEPPKQETKKSRELKGRRIKLVVKPKMFRNYSVTITDSPDEIKPNTLLALKSDSCRFIIGEVAGEDTIYCCGPRQKNYYCSQHAALCYEKPRKKYRRRAGTAPLLGRSAYFVKSF